MGALLRLTLQAPASSRIYVSPMHIHVLMMHAWVGHDCLLLHADDLPLKAHCNSVAGGHGGSPHVQLLRHVRHR